MKKLAFFLMAFITISCSSQEEIVDQPKTDAETDDAETTGEWQLEWEDDFNSTTLDTKVWSRTERGKADWANTQSQRDDLLEIKDGLLILKGIVNPNPVSADQLVNGQITVEADTAHYLTAGIHSNGKHSFSPEGRIEVRARLQGATGAWPAIWLMPYNGTESWPMGGEIDMMERLNFDKYVYQTIHSNYYDNLHNDYPRHYGTGNINVDDFNVYAVEFQNDELTFYINDNKTFSYKRLDSDTASSQGQFPFIKPWYMLIDMQLGGGWVGSVDPNDLPIEMDIDWVRQYVKK